jgi:putative hemolysin
MKRLLILLIPGIFLAACAHKSVNMPNPASLYCEELGGKTTIKNGENGQVGFCVFSDGVEIEEWQLYRRAHPQLTL